MGRISDRTRWRFGRRRPYFLVGALPFGVTFALLWSSFPFQSDAALFLTYASIYVANTLCSTVLAVPYIALLPELALGYHERTSANTFRAIGVVMAVLGTAVLVRPLVELFGGDSQGWARTGIVLGIWVALPWLIVHRVSFERPGFGGESSVGFVEGVRQLAGHRAYRRLCGLFLCGRITVDLVGAMLIFYFTYWLGRPEDFPIALGAMLITVALTLPVWLRISRRADKRTLFMLGAAWWIVIQIGLLSVGPDDPRWLVFGLIALAGIGYGVADMMPWSMLGDVTDADELRSGERREGVYAGFFTFLRKLGGATGVALAGFALELSGFTPGIEQTDGTLGTIRILTAAVPALFLVLAIGIARGYPLGRGLHQQILDELEQRRSVREPG